MKEITVTSKFFEYDNIEELTKEDRDLMFQAIEARKKAYAPYSKFHVGAALLLDTGEVILGSNQENAASPSGMCAERTAIYFAGANYPDSKILKLAVTGASQVQETKTPISPCGACRQAIAEYEVKQDKPIEVLFMGETGKVIKSNSLEGLLPFMFDKSSL